jgi:hypothetical protein
VTIREFANRALGVDDEIPGVHLFGVETPRPRIEAVRIVDMTSSNSWTAGNAAVAASLSSFDSHGIDTLAPTVMAVATLLAGLRPDVEPIPLTAHERRITRVLSEGVTNITQKCPTKRRGFHESVLPDGGQMTRDKETQLPISAWLARQFGRHGSQF